LLSYILLKRYKINNNKILILFDGKLELVDQKDMESYISWHFIRSVSLWTLVMYFIGCYEESENDFLWKQLLWVKKI
jgi:hypothetical protein